MSQPSTRQTLRQRALRAMIENAFFDWKSAVILALTVLLAFFLAENPVTGAGLPGWKWWYFAIGGVAAWSALFVSMVTDPAFGARVVANLLRQDCNPARLRNKELGARLEKALEYRQRIAEAFGSARKNILPEDLQLLESQVETWIRQMSDLASRIDTYENERVIQEDLRSAQSAIQNLQDKLKITKDETVREQILQTLHAREQQLDALRNLQNMMQKAELQMDSTVTALGTVYSQLLLVGVKDIDSGRARRLREDITEQVNQLQDLVSSVDEVYAHRT